MQVSPQFFICIQLHRATIDDACLIVHLLELAVLFLPVWSCARYLNMDNTHIVASFLSLFSLALSLKTRATILFQHLSERKKN